MAQKHPSYKKMMQEVAAAGKASKKAATKAAGGGNEGPKAIRSTYVVRGEP